jgi:hypothetical protein
MINGGKKLGKKMDGRDWWKRLIEEMKERDIGQRGI